MPPTIIKLSSQREALKARIALAKARHKSAADLEARQQMLTDKELKLHTRWERQQKRLAS